MREKGQEAPDRRRDAGADRSRARRLFEVIRQAVKDFYGTFLPQLARWLQLPPGTGSG